MSFQFSQTSLQLPVNEPRQEWQQQYNTIMQNSPNYQPQKNSNQYQQNSQNNTNHFNQREFDSYRSQDFGNKSLQNTTNLSGFNAEWQGQQSQKFISNRRHFNERYEVQASTITKQKQDYQQQINANDTQNLGLKSLQSETGLDIIFSNKAIKGGKRYNSKNWNKHDDQQEFQFKPHRRQIEVINHEETDPVVGRKKIVTDLTIVKPRIERIPKNYQSPMKTSQNSPQNANRFSTLRNSMFSQTLDGNTPNKQSNSSAQYLQKYKGIKQLLDQKLRQQKQDMEKSKRSYDFVMNQMQIDQKIQKDIEGKEYKKRSFENSLERSKSFERFVSY
eukprot:403373112